MLKRIVVLLLVGLTITLSGCVSATGGLKSYIDTSEGYQFLYPNGWIQVQVSNGPDVVFHDLIEETENVSVVISPVASGKTLQDLGSPGEVGYKLSKSAIAPPGSGREAELINAEAREGGGKTYYLLEYAVKLPNKERHNLASVVINQGKLYTFNASTTEKRWQKIKNQFQQVVDSFQVY
ncbi:photosystem II oxygen evolving complex protein PsbP [[Phormidium ambiguum] IAM M-71]|uniref:Photosystem II oxygen evolving complex protein PsbP n=1 Tax=[Phormidium ambiguum] IAM M-71 TaxID=454136 RepID=A0A1U7ILM9_9CYAN|nr:photosystem II reaction center PsbP [Phormidium ambiguum]OKH38102.1 photosystem II oxygen evolving complex protein PsbP [Phormidium ambiguum IAM M-71]